MTKFMNHLFVCDCGDVDHQFIISQPPADWYDEGEEKELLIHIHLRNDLNWFQKLKYVFLYLLGKQSQYGAFGEIIIKKDDITRIKQICDDFLQS